MLVIVEGEFDQDLDWVLLLGGRALFHVLSSYFRNSDSLVPCL